MGKIHGTAYLIIGFFVSFISWVFDFKKLMIFFFIGLIFAIYGGVRAGIDAYEYVKERKAKNAPKPAQQVRQQSSYRSQWKYCKKCGQASHLQAKFCHSCGNTTFHLR